MHPRLRVGLRLDPKWWALWLIVELHEKGLLDWSLQGRRHNLVDVPHERVLGSGRIVVLRLAQMPDWMRPTLHAKWQLPFADFQDLQLRRSLPFYWINFSYDASSSCHRRYGRKPTRTWTRPCGRGVHCGCGSYGRRRRRTSSIYRSGCICDLRPSRGYQKYGSSYPSPKPNTCPHRR